MKRREFLAEAAGLAFGTQAIAAPAGTTAVRGSALVIGNISYPKAPLRTPVADASEVSATLQRIGYQCTLALNVDRAQMRAAVHDFIGSLLAQRLPMVLFYAGHGVQIDGVNYLVPVDARFGEPTTVSEQALSLDEVFAEFQRVSGVQQIFILDACRANPYGDTSPIDWIPGLAAPTRAPSNALVAYSTEPGGLALDGTHDHSPYTRALLKFIASPGVPFIEVLQNVRQDVIDATDGAQVPWENTSLTRSFILREAIIVRARFEDVDDDALLVVNGEEALSWAQSGNQTKAIKLNKGRNAVAVKVFNQRSYTGGIPPLGHKPEGWRYRFTLTEAGGRILVSAQDREDRPPDAGPRHGHLFTVATFVLVVGDASDQVEVVDQNLRAWA